MSVTCTNDAQLVMPGTVLTHTGQLRHERSIALLVLLPGCPLRPVFVQFFLSIQLACSLSLSLKLLNIKNVDLARSFMTVETDSYLTTRDIIGWCAGLPTQLRSL